MGDDRRAGPRPEAAFWPEPVPSVRDPRDIHELLRLLVERGASDLHVKVGSRPGLRIDGTILR